eukprot:755370-Pleurochrysis_carterae.AAC.3
MLWCFCAGSSVHACNSQVRISVGEREPCARAVRESRARARLRPRTCARVCVRVLACWHARVGAGVGAGALVREDVRVHVSTSAWACVCAYACARAHARVRAHRSAADGCACVNQRSVEVESPLARREQNESARLPTKTRRLRNG